jgi:F-type H+-transporting ATPase subunit b
MTINWWTLGIQTVNVVILVWLLGRFFWRPMAAMIEQRRATTAKTLDDARAERDQAKAALADIDKTRAGFAKEREALLANAQGQAQQAQTASIAAGAKQIATMQEAAKAAIATERDAADKAWAEQASHLAVDIAGRLAARLNGAAVRESFLNWLVSSIQALPDGERQAACADGVTLDVISATELDPGNQDRCRARIADAFGGHALLAFTTDPTLIAGLELRGPTLAIANSWRADLGRILTDVTHDNRH